MSTQTQNQIPREIAHELTEIRDELKRAGYSPEQIEDIVRTVINVYLEVKRKVEQIQLHEDFDIVFPLGVDAFERKTIWLMSFRVLWREEEEDEEKAEEAEHIEKTLEDIVSNVCEKYDCEYDVSDTWYYAPAEPGAWVDETNFDILLPE